MSNGLSIPSLILGITSAGLITWPLLSKVNIRGPHVILGSFCSVMVLNLLLRTHVIHGPPYYSHLFATLVASSTYALTLFLITVGYRLSVWHPLHGYPGPWLCRVTSLWLTCISFTGRRHLVFDRLHARYGPIVRVGPNILSINDCSILGMYQYMEKSDAYRRPEPIKVVTLFFKNETELVHRDRKRIWSALFTTAGQMALMVPLEKRIWELMNCLERRQSQSTDGYVDFGLAISHWAYDFMGDMVFGGCNEFNLMKNGDPYRYIDTGKKAMIMLDGAGQTPWLIEILWCLPLSKNMKRLVSHSGEMIRARAASEKIPGHRDLASYLLDAGIPQMDLERDTIIAIQAGSDNTSVKSTLALFFLLAEPAYYRRLQAELDKAFPNPTGPLSLNELNNLPLLNGVINETLRLGSPYFLPRIIPSGGAVVEGRYIPEGTIVAHAAYSQQTSPDNFFPVPMEFRPERWMPEGLGPHTRTNKAALASFSFGPHACIAKNLAYQEMRMMLARLLLAYSMSLPKYFDAQAYRDGILNCRTTILTHRLFVKVERREGIDLDTVIA